MLNKVYYYINFILHYILRVVINVIAVSCYYKQGTV